MGEITLSSVDAAVVSSIGTEVHCACSSAYARAQKSHDAHEQREHERAGTSMRQCAPHASTRVSDSNADVHGTSGGESGEGGGGAGGGGGQTRGGRGAGGEGEGEGGDGEGLGGGGGDGSGDGAGGGVGGGLGGGGGCGSGKGAKVSRAQTYGRASSHGASLHVPLRSGGAEEPSSSTHAVDAIGSSR